MSQEKRRHHSPEDKVKILRLHLLEGKPISAVCEEHGIHPTLFYQWCSQSPKTLKKDVFLLTMGAEPWLEHPRGS